MNKKIALGTVQFGVPYGVANTLGKIAPEDVNKILNYCLEKGIKTLDTASAYGESEDALGTFGVENFDVITKLPQVPVNVSNLSGWVSKRFDDSLKKLDTKSIYGLLLHNPAQLNTDIGSQLYKSLQSLKDKGIVKKIGISIYEPSELDVLLGKYEFDIIQTPLNIIDNRLLEYDRLSKLKDKGVELHARSVFMQGLLLMSKETRPDKFKIWQNLWDSWDEYLKVNNCSALDACLNYILNIDEIDKVVLGVDSINHLKQILSSIEKKIDLEKFKFNINDQRILNPSNWASL